MISHFRDSIIQKIDQAQLMYHRLVLVVAPAGSGKTAALVEIAKHLGCRYINLNLELSRRLLDLTDRQRILQLPRLVDEIVVGAGSEVVLLDNIEIIFEVSLKQDPLRLLQSISRNRTVVVAWNGAIENGYLTYATPDHPEYRRYLARDLVVASPEVSA